MVQFLERTVQTGRGRLGAAHPVIKNSAPAAGARGGGGGPADPGSAKSLSLSFTDSVPESLRGVIPPLAPTKNHGMLTKKLAGLATLQPGARSAPAEIRIRCLAQSPNLKDPCLSCGCPATLQCQAVRNVN